MKMWYNCLGMRQLTLHHINQVKQTTIGHCTAVFNNEQIYITIFCFKKYSSFA